MDGKKLIEFAFVCLSSGIAAFNVQSGHPWYHLERMLDLSIERPYVYRSFYVQLCRQLAEWLEVNITAFLLVVVGLCYVGSYYFVRATIARYYDLPLLLPVYWSLGLLLLLFGFHNVYDGFTALFFAGCIYALAASRTFLYLVLFVLSAANRETTILLALAYIIFGNRNAY